MKRSLTVASHHEGDAIVRALDDPATRAFVVVVGILQPLSSGARARVLAHVEGMLNDPDTVGTQRAAARSYDARDYVRDEDLDADLRLGQMARTNAAGRSAE